MKIVLGGIHCILFFLVFLSLGPVTSGGFSGLVLVRKFSRANKAFGRANKEIQGSPTKLAFPLSSLSWTLGMWLQAIAPFDWCNEQGKLRYLSPRQASVRHHRCKRIQSFSRLPFRLSRGETSYSFPGLLFSLSFIFLIFTKFKRGIFLVFVYVSLVESVATRHSLN